MRNKEEYQDALNCITGMTRNELDNPTPDFAKKYLESDNLLQELIDHITPMKVIEIDNRPACPHCESFDIYDEQADHWNEMSFYYQKKFCGNCGGALIIDQEELIDNYEGKK